MRIIAFKNHFLIRKGCMCMFEGWVKCVSFVGMFFNVILNVIIVLVLKRGEGVERGEYFKICKYTILM